MEFQHRVLSNKLHYCNFQTNQNYQNLNSYPQSSYDYINRTSSENCYEQCEKSENEQFIPSFNSLIEHEKMEEIENEDDENEGDQSYWYFDSDEEEEEEEEIEYGPPAKLTLTPHNLKFYKNLYWFEKVQRINEWIESDSSSN